MNGQSQPDITAIINTINRNANAQTMLASEFLKHATTQQTKEFQDFLIKAISEIYAQSSSRTKIFITLGYVALFTIWHNTIHLLTRVETALIGLSLLISCAIFVVWEIYEMVTSARERNEFAKLGEVPPKDVGPRLSKIQEKIYRSNVGLMKQWHTVLGFIVATGFIGAVCLAGSFGRTLIMGGLR